MVNQKNLAVGTKRVREGKEKEKESEAPPPKKWNSIGLMGCGKLTPFYEHGYNINGGGSRPKF